MSGAAPSLPMLNGASGAARPDLAAEGLTAWIRDARNKRWQRSGSAARPSRTSAMPSGLVARRYASSSARRSSAVGGLALMTTTTSASSCVPIQSRISSGVISRRAPGANPNGGRMPRVA